jgi:hypothetical protein
MSPPPENDEGSPAREPSKSLLKSSERLTCRAPICNRQAGEPAATKALLNHASGVFIFENRQGHRKVFYTVERGPDTYTVERGPDTWRFGLLFSAESKFLREVSKASKGGRENGE